MKSNQNRLFFAIAIVVGGLFVLFRSYLSTRPPPVAEHSIADATEKVQEELDPERFDVRPEREDFPDIFARVRSQVVRQASAIEGIDRLGSAGAEDLGDAFVERLRFMLDPEPERDFAAFHKRGDPRDFEEWSNRFAKYMKSILDRDQNPAMDIDAVIVSVLRLGEDGDASEKQRRLGEGFGVLTGRGVELDVVPYDPLGEGFFVVEVILPMERRDVRNGKYGQTIQGYRFAWHNQMSMWIPFESVVYDGPGFVCTAPPL